VRQDRRQYGGSLRSERVGVNVPGVGARVDPAFPFGRDEDLPQQKPEKRRTEQAQEHPSPAFGVKAEHNDEESHCREGDPGAEPGPFDPTSS
jgi:hypothetical protein